MLRKSSIKALLQGVAEMTTNTFARTGSASSKEAMFDEDGLLTRPGSGGGGRRSRRGSKSSVESQDLLGGVANEVSERSNLIANRTAMKEFERRLLEIIGTKAYKETVLKFAKKQFCEESLKFYTAIYEWEAILSTNMKRKQAEANRMLSEYVAEGSQFENGCLSSQTREDLLSGEGVGLDFFDFAKAEVLNDIYMNTSLRVLIEQEYQTATNNDRKHS